MSCKIVFWHWVEYKKSLEAYNLCHRCRSYQIGELTEVEDTYSDKMLRAIDKLLDDNQIEEIRIIKLPTKTIIRGT